MAALFSMGTAGGRATLAGTTTAALGGTALAATLAGVLAGATLTAGLAGAFTGGFASTLATAFIAGLGAGLGAVLATTLTGNLATGLAAVLATVLAIGLAAGFLTSVFNGALALGLATGLLVLETAFAVTTLVGALALTFGVGLDTAFLGTTFLGTAFLTVALATAFLAGALALAMGLFTVLVFFVAGALTFLFTFLSPHKLRNTATGTAGLSVGLSSVIPCLMCFADFDLAAHCSYLPAESPANFQISPMLAYLSTFSGQTLLQTLQKDVFW
jgi:hypothetical protein